MIELFIKGDKSRTPMHTEPANEIVKAVNATEQIEVTPNWIGYFSPRTTNIVLDLTNLVAYINARCPVDIPEPPASGDYVLTSSGGSLSWTAISDCGTQSS